MEKTKLCSKDECNLIEEIEAFANRLEEFGIEDISLITFSSNGDIDAYFGVDRHTTLRVKVKKNWDKKTLEYKYD